MAGKSRERNQGLPTELQSLLFTLNQLDFRSNLKPQERAALVQALHNLMRQALGADQETRRLLIEALAPFSGLLYSYAHTGAIQAIRENDPEWLQNGLVALALEDLRADYRDTLVILSLLGHSAHKLSAPLDEMVNRAAAVANPKCAELLRGFFQRPIDDQSIELMGYREGKSKLGFTYVEFD